MEDALAYLKTISTSTGDDAFTHISEIVRTVLQAKAKNAVDILESSFLLKKTRFVSHEGDKPVKRGRDPSDVKPVKQFFSLFCQKEPEPAVKEEPKNEDEGEEEDDPPEEPEEPPVNEFEAQNMLMDSVFFDACGCGIGRLDTYLVILALKQLGDDPTFGIETVRFFGKFLGISNNYYVFESTLKEGANGDVEEEDVEEGEEGQEGEEKPKKSKNWGRPVDGIPLEEGVGTNAMVYWYCHRPGDACQKLPPVTPLQVKTARQLKKYLTGDPEAEVSGYPPFPGIELNYLRAQIARIAHATQIAPAGFYSASEDDGGEQTVTPAEDFTMPPTEQLVALEEWVHKNAMISKQGRSTKYEEPESEGEDQLEADGEEAVEGEEGEDDEEAQDEEEEEEAEQEEVPQEEEQPGPLRPISEDKDLLGMEGVKAWSICKSSSIKGLKHQVVCLRSHLWPGAYCVATPTSFSNVYVGYGVKNEPFKPSMPPPVQKEYRKQMVEATDLPPKPDPPPPQDEEEGVGDEAGDGEEDDDEEEY